MLIGVFFLVFYRLSSLLLLFIIFFWLEARFIFAKSQIEPG